MNKPKFMSILIAFMTTHGIAIEMDQSELAEHTHTDGDCPHCDEEHGGLGIKAGIADLMAAPGAAEMLKQVFESLDPPTLKSELPHGIVTVMELVERLCEIQIRINVSKYLDSVGVGDGTPEERMPHVDYFFDHMDDSSVETLRDDVYQIFVDVVGYEKRWMRLTVFNRVVQEQAKRNVREHIDQLMSSIMSGREDVPDADEPAYQLN